MNKIIKKYIRTTALPTLFLIGLLAFCVLAGDENPNAPLPLGKWLFIKLTSLVVLIACVLTGKHLYKKGYIDKINVLEGE